MVELRVLGDVGIWIGNCRLDVGPARQRSVFAVMAVEANRIVTVDQLLARVWPHGLPLRARQVLCNYLSRLRLRLAPEGIGIERRTNGYVLVAAEGVVDLQHFRHLIASARDAEDAHAFSLFNEALALWRGEPFAGLDTPWLSAVRTGLERERDAARLDRVDAALRCGRHAEVLPELFELVDQDAADERVAGQFMLALHRVGRTADALAHYRQVRARTVEHQGAEPGSALRELHQRILDSDPVAGQSSSAAITNWTASTTETPVPRQLPASPRWFTGRGVELARLDQALVTCQHEDPQRSGAGSGSGSSETVLISAIGGAGGIGKTWLAVAWAHRHAERFPDGQLFVDLHGFSPTQEPTAPEAAVRGFLDALGISPDVIPSSLDAQAALYRSLIAGKRMLIMLDNAATVDQVLPLLPGDAACTVLITGRAKLASLIDRYGVRHLQLDVLADSEAHALLVARLGADRVAAEPEATDELVRLCGGYPLALAITARHAGSSPAVSLTEVAAELRERGLEMLDHETDPAASLPAVLSCSVDTLTDEQRTVFKLLGITPGPDTTLPAVVALTGLPAARARRALSGLEEASLLERRPHNRYAMHDLVRAYATHNLPDNVTEALGGVR